MTIVTYEDAFLKQLAHAMPIEIGTADLRGKRVGLVVVDPVQGFCDFGALSDPRSMAPMVTAIDALARRLLEAVAGRSASEGPHGGPGRESGRERVGPRWASPSGAGRSPVGKGVPSPNQDDSGQARVLVFRDAHTPGVPEPPYPPHCERGTGEELVTPRLRWLADAPATTVLDKDCINGFVGAIGRAGENRFVDWVRSGELDALIVTGDCTDICVLDFVVTTLSARNHGLLGRLGPVVVYTPGVATYDLGDPVALGLPELIRHPAAPFHHAALAMMARRGAVLADKVEV